MLVGERTWAELAAAVARRAGHANLCFATADTAAGLEAALAEAGVRTSSRSAGESANSTVAVVVFGSEEDAALAAAEPIAAVGRLATDDAWIFFTADSTGRWRATTRCCRRSSRRSAA